MILPGAVMSYRGEFELIDWIKKRIGPLPGFIPTGVGDDCAVFKPLPGSEVVITTDMLVQDVDFRMEWMPRRFLGRKALAVCLSDLAAMGARPEACLLALALPAELTGAFFEELLSGFLDGCAFWQAPLIGGDLSAADRVTLAVTAIGSVPAGKAIHRRGAQPGDLIVLIGEVGLAASGLSLLEAEKPDLGERIKSAGELEQWAHTAGRFRFLKAHLLPEPLLQAGLWIREQAFATAMIDVSDGLVPDLFHILEASQVAAELESQHLGPSDALSSSLTEQAVLYGGEDFALLLTLPAARLDEMRRKYPQHLAATRVLGRIIPGSPEIFLREEGKRRKLSPGGFEHFL
jgi:thiamine-monophosphate kinase